MQTCGQASETNDDQLRNEPIDENARDEIEDSQAEVIDAREEQTDWRFLDEQLSNDHLVTY